MIITLLTIIAFSIIFESHIEPLEWFKKKMGLSTTSMSYSKIWLVNTIILALRHLLNCGGCISFWTTLIVLGFTFEVFKYALIIYVVTYYLSSKINTVSF